MKEVVLEAGGLLRGSSGPALESFLLRHRGIHRAEASYMSETVTVEYDEAEISEEELYGLIEDWDMGAVTSLHNWGSGCTEQYEARCGRASPIRFDLPDLFASDFRLDCWQCSTSARTSTRTSRGGM